MVGTGGGGGGREGGGGGSRGGGEGGGGRIAYTGCSNINSKRHLQIIQSVQCSQYIFATINCY